MSRRWMYGDRTSLEYLSGVDEFCKRALEHKRLTQADAIFCPCRDCNNIKRWVNIEDIEDHLIRRGFKEKYNVWNWHGESFDSNEADDMEEMSGESNPNSYENDKTPEADNGEDDIGETDRIDDMMDDEHLKDQPRAFESLEKAADTPLYHGCTRYSKLTAVLTLYNLKAKSGWSDSSFTSLLEVLHDMFPEGNVIPTSTYYAKKLMNPLGLESTKIDACPNDCILYRKKYAHLDVCPKCGESRYKRKVSGSTKSIGPSSKVAWYMDVIPRFKRLFSIKTDAENLRWHAQGKGRKKDGKLRHPADSPQWRNIDKEFEVFGKEPRNLRLALCTDGMNPYGSLNSQHSTWPVLLAIYNLPPWLCMKRKYIMLALLISGPKQPGNDIDVYLEPLIDDLKLLWDEGVQVYDAYADEIFTLRAMIFCTINDFPAYGNLSGYKTKGEQACPICEEDMVPTRLSHYKKNVYMNHRRFLPRYHPYRRNKKQFNGCTEEGEARMPLSGFQVYERIKHTETVYGKCVKQKTKKGVLWKKVSTFWSLPYWKYLDVRHCLDLMHIEKNVCDAIVGTLLNIPNKTKDNVNVRRDMQEKNIRPHLWPQDKEGGSKTYLPPACYTLSKLEKRKFCECLYGIKVPTGYSSNVRRLVSMDDYKLVGMKSHDCHIMLEIFLPIAIRGILPNHVRHVIIKLCLFFNIISSKVIDPEKLDGYQNDVIETLCKFEMYFPPSFFDIMVHLIVHLVREIKLCGPVYMRYMWPFERHMGILQDKARNPAKPEASIIVNTLMEEISEYCAEFVARAKVIGVPISRHEGRLSGQGTIGKKLQKPPIERKDQAHRYVLQHLSEVHPYLEKHVEFLKQENPKMGERALMRKHNSSFVTWFQTYVYDNMNNLENEISETIRWLAWGPRLLVATYQAYDINGYSFYTRQQDEKSVQQNSGVMVVASSREFASSKDKLPIDAKQAYYGVIEEIWELDYVDFTIPLFRCKWADNRRGRKLDEYGFTLVDSNRFSEGEEPFVLASQAKQIFYIVDNVHHQWRVVAQGKRRILGVEDVVDEDEYDEFDDIPPLSMGVNPMPDGADIDGNYMRTDHDEGIEIVNNTKASKP